MKSPSILLSLPLLLLLAPSPASAVAPQQPVGSAIVVVNLVTAALNRDTRSLQSGDRVHQHETIEVGLDAQSELELDDDTKLALGPGSRLTLDKFVYDPQKTKGSIVLDLMKGTFRFMTGVAEKPTYVIKTPAAAITVRGTIFDVYVEDDGLAWLLLHEGAIQVCNARGECRELDEPGKLIRIGDDGDVGNPVRWAALEGKDSVPFDDAFPFVSKSPGFDPDPALTRDAIILGALPKTYEPKKKTETKKKAETRKTPVKTKRAAKTPSKSKKKSGRKQAKQDSGGSSGVGNFVTGVGVGLAIGAIGRGGGKGRGGGSYGGRKPY